MEPKGGQPAYPALRCSFDCQLSTIGFRPGVGSYSGTPGMLGLIFSHLVKQGTLTVVWPNGDTNVYGSGSPRATIRITGRFTSWRIASNPELAFREADMDGRVTVTSGAIADVLEILIFNMGHDRPPAIARLERAFRRCIRMIAQFNPVGRP